jgi:hypothetical protein
MSVPVTLLLFFSPLRIECVKIVHQQPACNNNAVKITFNTGRFIMFPVITNIYNKKTKGPTLMEMFTATGRTKKFF